MRLLIGVNFQKEQGPQQMLRLSCELVEAMFINEIPCLLTNEPANAKHCPKIPLASLCEVVTADCREKEWIVSVSFNNSEANVAKDLPRKFHDEDKEEEWGVKKMMMVKNNFLFLWVKQTGIFACFLIVVSLHASYHLTYFSYSFLWFPKINRFSNKEAIVFFREYFLKHGSENNNVSFTYALESCIFVQGFDGNKNETGC